MTLQNCFLFLSGSKNIFLLQSYILQTHGDMTGKGRAGAKLVDSFNADKKIFK